MWSAALLQWLGLAWLGGEPVRVVSSSLSSLSSKMFRANFLLLVDRGVAFFFRELDFGVFLTLRDEWARMELGLMDPSTFPRGDSGFMLDRSIDVLMNCIVAASSNGKKLKCTKIRDVIFKKLHFRNSRTRRVRHTDEYQTINDHRERHDLQSAAATNNYLLKHNRIAKSTSYQVEGCPGPVVIALVSIRCETSVSGV